VRRQLLKLISVALTGKLQSAYENLRDACQPYTISNKATGARALRNQCMSLLVAGGGEQADEMARVHYEGADNITDRVAALGAAVVQWTDGAPALLADFKEKYCDDMLVYDKWLALSARAPDEDCLDRVKAIYAEPTFPKNNPNRLRSLIGVFSMSNSAQFSRPDGAGFEFVTQFCAEIDERNPQVAARVLTAFRNWRNYEPGRRFYFHDNDGLEIEVVSYLPQK
jgi:aminopeptidase N